MDLRGKTFVITRANSGLGAVTARAIASAGGRVIMACRDVEKANAVAAEIGKSAQVRQLDLADLASVRQFAASLDEVDTLINNAGVMAAFAQSAQAGSLGDLRRKRAGGTGRILRPETASRLSATGELQHEVP
jgi:NADP-dependent 3-hydroxy acid dehydrogenase YdfG